MYKALLLAAFELTIASCPEAKIETAKRKPPRVAGAHDALSSAIHGQSNSYISYLRDTVFPFVADKYRADESRRL